MSENWQDDVTPVLRHLQLVVGGLTLGAVVFLAIAFFAAGEAGGGRVSAITYVALLLAAVEIPASSIYFSVTLARNRRIIARNEWAGGNARALGPLHPFSAEFRLRTGDAGALWETLSASRMAAAAMLEGAAFLLISAYIVDRSPWSLYAVAVVVAVMLAVNFPTRSRLVHWTETQLRLLDEERQLRS